MWSLPLVELIQTGPYAALGTDTEKTLLQGTAVLLPSSQLLKVSGSSNLELTGHFEYDQNQNAVILEQAQSGHREQQKDELRVCPIWDAFPALPLTNCVT